VWEVSVRDGVVDRVRESRSESEHILCPTLLDMQVNGVNGIDLQRPELSAEDLVGITEYLAKHGVSRWVPTLVTASLEAMEHAARVIAEACALPELKHAVPGIHLEGPWISPLDGPRGAHPVAHVQLPGVEDFRRLEHACGGKLLYVTLAPELKGAPKLIRAIRASGARVSLGHHHGDAAAVAAAADAGATLCTHLGNGAMARMQRHFNPLWPQLADDRLSASVIADLHHLPEPVLRTFVRAKGARRLISVSDAVHLAGLQPGRYTLFEGEVELLKIGKIVIPGSDLLAGSATMLIQGVANLARHTDLSWPQALRTATSNPARALGLPPRTAKPKAGACADFVVFDGGRERVTPEAVWVRGERMA